MKLNDSEWTVMNVLWERHPASAREVLEGLGGEVDWAYTTVKTLLTRLEDKGVLRSSLRGNTKIFEAVVSRERAQKTAVAGLIDRAFGGAASSLFHHLIGEGRIPKRRQAELADLIEEIRKGEGVGEGKGGGERKGEGKRV